MDRHLKILAGARPNQCFGDMCVPNYPRHANRATFFGKTEFGRKLEWGFFEFFNTIRPMQTSPHPGTKFDRKLDVDRPMQKISEITRGRVVKPAQLSDSERNVLSQQLYSVHQKIFAGVSAEEFHRHVIEPPAETTAIQLYCAADQSVIGYCAVHRYRRQVHGRNAIVLRAEAGLMPECRGRGATYGFGIVRALIEKLSHPFTPVYYLGTLVHTSSYHLFCKYFPRVYPHPDIEMPNGIREIALQLIESFPDPAVLPADPFVRNVGWVTIETPQEKHFNQQTDPPDVQFFKLRNPGFSRGHGLVLLIPITWRNLSGALFSRLYERTLIALGRHKPQL